MMIAPILYDTPVNCFINVYITWIYYNIYVVVSLYRLNYGLFIGHKTYLVRVL